MRQQLRSELEAPAELRKFGSGWIAGTIALALSLGALFLVLILRQPALLGMPELGALRDSSWIKPVLFVDMIAAFLLAVTLHRLALHVRPIRCAPERS